MSSRTIRVAPNGTSTARSASSVTWATGVRGCVEVVVERVRRAAVDRRVDLRAAVRVALLRALVLGVRPELVRRPVAAVVVLVVVAMLVYSTAVAFKLSRPRRGTNARTHVCKPPG